MFDDFGLYPRDEPFDPFSVMLFKALQVVAFLFFIALLAIAPQAKEGKIESKAEFIVTMDWPDNHPDDLDLFVQDAPATSPGTGIGKPASWSSNVTIAAAPMISLW